MSVGEIITYGSETYRVAEIGYEILNDNLEFRSADQFDMIRTHYRDVTWMPQISLRRKDNDFMSNCAFYPGFDRTSAYLHFLEVPHDMTRPPAISYPIGFMPKSTLDQIKTVIHGPVAVIPFSTLTLSKLRHVMNQRHYHGENVSNHDVQLLLELHDVFNKIKCDYDGFYREFSKQRVPNSRIFRFD